jgi:hypothetical protein
MVTDRSAINMAYAKKKKMEKRNELRKEIEAILGIAIPENVTARTLYTIHNEVVTYKQGKKFLDITEQECRRIPNVGLATLEEIRSILHGNEDWPEKRNLVKHQFVNRVRSLYNIDRHLLPELDGEEWIRFRDDPPRFLIKTNEKNAKAILREIEKRQ